MIKEILFVLYRDLGSQIAISRNMSETNGTKLRRFMWALYFTGKAFCVAARSIKHEAIGEFVIYKDKKCMISNWAGTAYPTLIVDGKRTIGCDRSEMTKINNFSTYTHRFRAAFWWYMGSWLGNEISAKLYPSFNFKESK